MKPTVRVIGEGSVVTEPDAGELAITLTEIQPSPGPALAAVARRTERLLDLLDELGVPAAARTTSGVSVAEEFDARIAGPHWEISAGHPAWLAAATAAAATAAERADA
jgi:uncharacterized protein YggE